MSACVLDASAILAYLFRERGTDAVERCDRACLALGLGLSLPVVTADANWSLVSAALGVRVEQFR